MSAMKLTIEHLESMIAREQFHVFEGTTMTVCCLTLENGFAVVGESACILPEDFNEAYGREIARLNALNKVWQLEGYRVKSTTNQRNQA
jgi:hypothetical protein